jgi:hypothetical protein
MKERPIIFSAPMVRALLEGRKTQTRRIVKDVSKLRIRLPKAVQGDWPIGHTLRAEAGVHFAHLNQHGAVSVATSSGLLGVKPGEFEWEHRKLGDRLWVRETWMHGGNAAPAYGRKYKADGHTVDGLGDFEGGPWRNCMFMPRWASRITLEIVDVRVQRLGQITEEDAREEGAECADVPGTYRKGDPVPQSFRQGFYQIWCMIHGADLWDANPWVWALTFERVQA